MRKLLTSVAELAGLALITAGAAVANTAAGLVAGGVSLVVIGFLAGDE